MAVAWFVYWDRNRTPQFIGVGPNNRGRNRYSITGRVWFASEASLKAVMSSIFRSVRSNLTWGIASFLILGIFNFDSTARQNATMTNDVQVFGLDTWGVS